MLGKKSVPFFEYPRLYTDDREAILQIVDDVGSRGAFIMQDDLEKFERSLSLYTGAKYAVGVANATDGLEICWTAIGLAPGDEVICCAHTMLATASAIKVAGGTPVPVDMGDDWLISPDAIEQAITSRTVGIMPTQLNGRVCNMDRICQIASIHGLHIVEDAAQALGAYYRGKHAGTFGAASAISFFPAKVMGALGDAGGVLTNSEDLFDKIFQLHDHGRDVKGDVRSWGRNSRLDNLQAAILNYKFKTYNSHVVKRRRVVAGMYEEGLSTLEQVTLPPAPVDNAENFDVYQNYELTAQSRDGLKQHLADNGIGTLVQWGGKALHHFSLLNTDNPLDKTDDFFNSCIMLPMNVFISDDDVQYVIETVKDFYNR